jgi:T-complex protein 1 subunit theta
MMVSAPNELLKDGSKHLVGVSEATLQSIDAVKQFTQVVRTSLGPNGMNKMIVNHLEKLFVTNDAATIIKELDVVHPAAKIGVLASQMQEQEMGDGTNLVLVLVGEFLQNAEALLYQGLHPSEIISGYNKAATKAGEILESLVVHEVKDFKNVDQVTQVIKHAIASKQYGYEDTLAPLIAKACIEVTPAKSSSSFNVDNVRVAKILGGGVLDTQVIKGHVLVRDTEGTIKHVKKAKVVVFSAGVDMSKPETKDTIQIHNADELLNYNKSEEKWIEAIIKEVADSGAKVLVSGGAIGEMAMHFIERYGLMAVKVASKFELRRICKAVGATPLVRLGKPLPEELGYCDYVSAEEIGSTKVTVFRQDAPENDSGIATIVVRASTQNTLDDFERAIDDGVNVYKVLLKDPRFVAGAGATEIELSRRLQGVADETPGLMQYAIRKYGEAFEVIPRTLAENAGLKAIDIVSSLYAAHSKGMVNGGVNVEDGTIHETSVLDSIAIKANAIRLATHATVTILQVDQIIMSKPAGGPKMPKQGPMDADD